MKHVAKHGLHMVDVDSATILINQALLYAHIHTYVYITIRAEATTLSYHEHQHTPNERQTPQMPLLLGDTATENRDEDDASGQWTSIFYNKLQHTKHEKRNA